MACVLEWSRMRQSAGPIPARFGSNGVKTFQPVYSNRAEEVAVRKVLAQKSMAFHSCAMKVYIVN